MRKCSTCKTTKPLSEFHRKGNGYRYKCKICQSEYIKQHYVKNKKKYKQSSKNVRKRNREYIQRLKESTPCADCNTHYPHYVMDFDHLRDKEFCISRLSLKGINQIKSEILKCEIVCSNCHRQRTYNRSIRT